jgi:hypothetical protein
VFITEETVTLVLTAVRTSSLTISPSLLQYIAHILFKSWSTQKTKFRRHTPNDKKCCSSAPALSTTDTTIYKCYDFKYRHHTMQNSDYTLPNLVDVKTQAMKHTTEKEAVQYCISHQILTETKSMK